MLLRGRSAADKDELDAKLDEVERAASAKLEEFELYSTAKLGAVETLLDNAVNKIESMQLGLQAANDRAAVVSIPFTLFLLFRHARNVRIVDLLPPCSLACSRSLVQFCSKVSISFADGCVDLK